MTEKAPYPDNKNPETPLDRQAYLKEIRRGLLKKLGLPEGTKPENVAKLLEIKAKMSEHKK